MKILIPLIACLLIISMSSFYPTVAAARTTTIYLVLGPSGVAAGSENPMPLAVTVYYNNSLPGYHLVVGVLDAQLSPKRIVPGVVVSSTTPCTNQPAASALCAIVVPNSSGVVRIAFQLGGIFGGRQKLGTWELNVTSVLIDNQNAIVVGSVSSRLFKVSLTPVALNVNVPSNVAVSVDGLLQPSGTVSVGVTLGRHNVTVPRFVNVTQFTRLRFIRWSDGYPSPLRTVVVANFMTLQADYVTQNLLTLIGVQGNASLSTWYDANTNATYSANRYEPMSGGLGEFGLRLSFQGWNENGQLLTNSLKGTISMNKPHTLTAVWQIDYSETGAILLGVIAAAVTALLLIQRERRPPTVSSHLKKGRRPGTAAKYPRVFSTNRFP
jgi:hypothetical protein